MNEIEGEVYSQLRRRLVERGVTAYNDQEIFERVRAIMQNGVDRESSPTLAPAALDGLLLPELLGDDVDWTLEPNLRLSSHRPLFGEAIVFAKRRLLLPLTRWLFEYSQTNFRKQQHLNRVLLACLEELAIENARLRRDLTALSNK